MNHTPGPWFFECEENYHAGGFVYNATTKEADDGRSICDIRPSRRIKHADKRRADSWTASAEDVANARLIAAAPDLLHALNLMLREHDALCLANCTTEDRWPAAGIARAAINKARGE